MEFSSRYTIIPPRLFRTARTRLHSTGFGRCLRRLFGFRRWRVNGIRRARLRRAWLRALRKRLPSLAESSGENGGRDECSQFETRRSKIENTENTAHDRSE